MSHTGWSRRQSSGPASRHCRPSFFSPESRFDCYMICGGTRKTRKTSSSCASRARLRRCMCTIMPWRTGTIPGGKVTSPLAFSRSHLRSRTPAHPDRLATLYITICACLTDIYKRPSKLKLSVGRLCVNVCVDEQEHEDFRAEHPVAAAQGKPMG